MSSVIVKDKMRKYIDEEVYAISEDYRKFCDNVINEVFTEHSLMYFIGNLCVEKLAEKEKLLGITSKKERSKSYIVDGRWSGYQIEFFKDNIKYTAITKEGAKGLNMLVAVEIFNDYEFLFRFEGKPLDIITMIREI
jgi:hypothetical protein